MCFQETFTFKTRRKGNNILLASLLLTNLVSHALAANHQTCPDRCECYVDLLYEFNLHTAACDTLVWNRVYFPNIVQLKLTPPSPSEQCHLPNITSKMFPNLQRLDMSNCSLTSVPSAGPNDFKKLSAMDLSNNLIQSIPLDAFDSYRHLQHLTLTNNSLSQSQLSIKSDSLYELFLDSCRIQNVSSATFAGTPKLKHLSLSNNSISVVPANTFPESLRTIDLSNNTIVNVPINEFLRLLNLAQLNLAANPINCTCSLVGFQDWLSGKAVVFVGGITCAHPSKYAGLNLARVSEEDMCESKMLDDSSSSKEVCGTNQICNNGIITDDGYVNDQDTDENKNAFQEDQVIPVGDKSMVKEDLREIEGSGDEDTTDIPEETAKIAPKTSTINTTSSTTTPTNTSNSSTVLTDTTNSTIMNSTDATNSTVINSTDATNSTATNSTDATNSTTISSTDASNSSDARSSSSNTTAETPSPQSSETTSPIGIVKSVEELNTTSETPSTEMSTVASSESTAQISSTETPVIVTSQNTSIETSNANFSESQTEIPIIASSESSVKNSTTGESESETVAPEPNNTNTQLQEPLRHDNGHREVFGYILPGLAVLLIGLVCLAVYCSQCASKVETYKQTEADVEGAELQEVSLLPDNNHATIVKHSNKYPGEKENGQTESLMGDHEQTNGGNSVVAEINGNGSQHSDDTIDCCKLSNGQSTNTNQNGRGNVECTVVRVTTLPDSLPKTAVIRDL